MGQPVPFPVASILNFLCFVEHSLDEQQNADVGVADRIV